MKAIVDTNIFISHYQKGLHRDLLHQLNAEHQIHLHGVVLTELYAGTVTRAFTRELNRLDRTYRTKQRLVIPQARDYRTAGFVLNRLGQTSSLLADSLIAASARHEGMLLVTEDGDFERIRKIIPFRLMLVNKSHS